MSKPESLKIDEVEYVRKDSIKERLVVPKGDASNPFMEVGRDYFLRTVTNYFTGRLVWVGDKELVIEDAAWIADTGRFNQFVAGGTGNEVEPFPIGSRVIVARGALVDMVERKGGLLLTVK